MIGDLKLTPEAEAFVSKAGPDRVGFQLCDVSKWDQLQKLVATSEEKYGDVPDVWIAGAGVFEPVSLRVQYSVPLFQTYPST
jgi:NAD(P)-dependent dehydrogenase (short-subunit alcohol dehydrogenase family)